MIEGIEILHNGEWREVESIVSHSDQTDEPYQFKIGETHILPSEIKGLRFKDTGLDKEFMYEIYTDDELYAATDSPDEAMKYFREGVEALRKTEIFEVTRSSKLILHSPGVE